MRVPVPNDRLVALTLAGALLTTVVAGALALPLGGTPGDQSPTPTTASGVPQVADDAPTPNRNFTPAVQTQSGYEHEEHEEEEHEEEEEKEEDREENEDEEREEEG